jgi:2-polyprenyl-3-methyl-5-hydroxy-6-metoxy-1,4-benzoquinol methylase
MNGGSSTPNSGPAPEPTGETADAKAPAFNYEGIPVGYYDEIMRGQSGVRRLWHVSKFERVLDYLPPEDGGSILDIGCFAGTFLSMVPRYRFERQLGVDILKDQIAYATHHHGTAFREFRYVPNVAELKKLPGPFNCITNIEVIEHLEAAEARQLLEGVNELLAPNGTFIMTTPNYTSTWPLLEVVLNKVSEVSYQEQHITKFTFFGFERELERIWPEVWSHFDLDVKTTTHFITPFLGGLSFEIARGLSRVVPHAKWRHPFGNLILAVLRKRPQQKR